MINFNKLLPHFIIVFLFAVISLIYLSPLLEGKMLNMMDVNHWKGMSKEVLEFRESTNQEPLWTNSMFSGMPAYQISTKYKANLVQYVPKIISFGLPRPANILFLYMLGFYILLLSLKIDYKIAALGSFAFAFSSYFLIIIQAGHMTKAHAIAYMPMVIASVLYTYRGNILLGGVFTALTVSLELYANHFQITYYLIFILFFIAIIHLIHAFRKKSLNDFFKRSAVLLLAGVLASGTSLTRLITTIEYGSESTRGKSEITSNIENKTSGLDKDYATAWSYGISESFTLLIPNFHGGSSSNSVLSLEDSKTMDFLRSYSSKNPRNQQIGNFLASRKSSSYWGEQPFTSGPTYVGSIVVFLFILGLFLIKSKIRVWVILATLTSLMLAWGKNFMPLTDLFLDYFPAYNKFRAVSMILVIAELTIPLLAFITLDKLLHFNSGLKNKLQKSLKFAFLISGGFCLVFALLPTIFYDFLSQRDLAPIAEGINTPDKFLDALASDRAYLFSKDAWRSFMFISSCFVLLWFYIKNKINYNLTLFVIALLVISDMWSINKRYLNDTHFVRKSKFKIPYKPNQADKIIYDNEGLSFNSYPSMPHFRVLNNRDAFNDANTSYFHKSIGGYHGAKLKRYQELIVNHISKDNENSSVLNMLNTKYIIDEDGTVQENNSALGNAWFVNSVQIVENADQELLSLNNFSPKDMAIVDKRFENDVYKNLFSNKGVIDLLEYKPNYLKYKSESNVNGIAVFSEVYYDKGWNAYIDGEIQPHFRANYILRALNVPAGNHIIEFKFEPNLYKTGETVSLASSLILILLLAFLSFKELRYK